MRAARNSREAYTAADARKQVLLSDEAGNVQPMPLSTVTKEIDKLKREKHTFPNTLTAKASTNFKGARHGGGGTHFPHSNGVNYIRGDMFWDGHRWVHNGGLQLGSKFLLSGKGDKFADDSWLRLMHPTKREYYGGFAAGQLYSSGDVRAKRLCMGGTCIDQRHLQVLTGQRDFLMPHHRRGLHECVDCGRGDDNCHLHNCDWSNRNQIQRMRIRP